MTPSVALEWILRLRLPSIGLAVVLILVGWLVARLMEAFTRRAAARLGQRLPDSLRWPVTTERWIGRVVFWGVLAGACAFALQVPGIPGLSAWPAELALYIPRLLTGLALGVVGTLSAGVARITVTRAAAAAQMRSPRQLGAAAEMLLLAVTALVVADHVGIDVGFLTTSASIILASVLGAAALAFGLGSRLLVENILAGHYVQKMYEVGQTVRIGDAEGRIVRTTPIAVVLEGPQGETSIPASAFVKTRSDRIRTGGTP